MQIVFISNFINHHQKPLSDEFYKITNGDYTFIATEPTPKSFIESGYPEYTSLPYLLNAFESDTKYQEAIELAEKAEVVICSGPDIFTKKRITENKLTFRYAERFFKKRPFWQHPGMIKYLFFHDAIYRKKNLYMLAASAYLANEMKIVGAYPNKIYKWGYFPAVNEIDIKLLLSKIKRRTIKIVWCARFIDWKHPEMIPLLARKLLDNGICNFDIEMIGNGIMSNQISKLIYDLKVDKYVKLVGNIQNEEVVKKLLNANIFLFTSDRNEGWGAVLNEAMASGCAVVVSKEIGAAPYLIEDGVNGFIFKSNSLCSLYQKTAMLINDDDLQQKMAFHAYDTMIHKWSPRIAAQAFYELASCLLSGKCYNKTEGPCSKALSI